MESPTLPSATRRAWVTVVVMAAVLMQVLDMTIANVALPHMQATLGATSETIAWVLTSYIVAAAIATPLTGWLEGRLGRRPLFLIAIGGFTAASAACGLAPTIEAMVAARICQGLFGAFVGPLAQATLLDAYPKEKHPQALTIWGLGVMIGPIMGPMLGGWLTEQFDWRWVFFINVPIGAAVAVGVLFFVRAGSTQARRFDVFGFAMLALALGAFQLMLDRGTQLDWFESTEIIVELGVLLSAMWIYVIHTMTARNPLIPVSLFRDRNFMIANIFLLIATGIMMAGAALIAPMLQRMLGYGTFEAGLLVAPRGLALAVSTVIAGKLSGKVDPRVMIAFGFLLTAVSQWMMTGFSLEMGSGPVIWSGIVQGFALGFVMMPLNLLAFETLAPAVRTDAASVYSLSRNIGASISISIMTSLIARNVQVSHADLGAHVTAVDAPYLHAGLIERIGLRAEMLFAMIDGEINRQAAMVAYIDDFWLMVWGAALAAPLVIFMRVRKGAGTSPPPMME